MAISMLKGAVAGSLALASVALAQPTPEKKCEAGMVDKGARYASCLAKAQAKYSVGVGDFLRAESACADKMVDSWERIETDAADAGATCPSVNTQDEVQHFFDACMDALWETARGEELPLDVRTCNAGMYWLGRGAKLGSAAHAVPSIVVDPDVLFGVAIDVPYKVMVTGLGIVGNSAGPNVKLALYRSTAGVGELLVATGSSPLPDGSLTIDVPVLALEPGRYLLIAVFDAEARLGSSFTYVTRVHGSMGFLDPFPDPADSLGYSGGDVPSLFLQLF